MVEKRRNPGKKMGSKETIDGILYVSDLDGTLMKNDETLSQDTVEIINELVQKGLSFTYATARSIESARTITGELNLKLPVITRNGVAKFLKRQMESE